jgi:hypothetical protein
MYINIIKICTEEKYENRIEIRSLKLEIENLFFKLTENEFLI